MPYKTIFFEDFIRSEPKIARWRRRNGKREQARAKRKPKTRKRERKEAKREPKWREWEPKVNQKGVKGCEKGAKGGQKGGQREQKGAKREPKNDQNGSKNRLGRQGRFWERKVDVARDILEPFLVQKSKKRHPKKHQKIDAEKVSKNDAKRWPKWCKNGCQNHDFSIFLRRADFSKIVVFI